MISKKSLRKRYNFWAVATFALVALAFSAATAIMGIAADKPKTIAEVALYKGADRQKILEEGAKKEGKLMFYHTGMVNNAVRRIFEAFRKKYPFINMQTWRERSETILPRMFEERKSGKDFVDIIEGTQMTAVILQKQGLIQPFYSPEQAYYRNDAFAEAPEGGVYFVTFREMGVSLGYNTNLITKEEIPKTYQDLLNPKWKGKIPLSTSSAGKNFMGSMLVSYGEDFVRRMAKQDFIIHTVTAKAISDMVVAGEYMFCPTIYYNHISTVKRVGAPVDWFPLEPVPVTLGRIALAKHSTHPHAALLLIDFQLSKESALIRRDEDFNSPRKDVSGGTTYKQFIGAKSYEEQVKWIKLFNKLFLE
ncbi:ABC transporter substrate-binding protein [Thermodesulfobacteriota bacterium]